MASDRIARLEALLREAKQREGPALPERIGPYRIVRSLGEGGMGRVLLAHDTELDRDVALKLIRPEFRFVGEARERFAREAKAASKLDHPGICHVYELGEHDGVPFLAMQYVEGRTLAELIGYARAECCRHVRVRGGRLEDLAAVFESLGRTLHAAHEAGLVHRDIKPSNVILTAAGEPVLLDFGVALDERNRDQSLTLSGQMIGTPLYLPPEQITCDAARNERRADVYSLAVTLYECMTLARPFGGSTQHEIFDAILHSMPPRPRRLNSEIPRDLEVVVVTAMDKEPGRRYATALDFAEDLARVRAREPIRARPQGPVLRLRRWTQRNPLATALVVVLVLAVAGSLALWLRSENALDRFYMLATGVRLQQAIDARVDDLPARAENEATFRRWLETKAEPLLAERLRLTAALAQLRQRALPYDAETKQRDQEHHPRLLEVAKQLRLRANIERLLTSARLSRQYAARRQAEVSARLDELRADPGALRTHAFADPADRFLHDGLERLLRDLRAFAREQVARVRDQLAWTRVVSSRSITSSDLEARWRTAARSVARNPRYANLHLVPQLGLVPLGADPVSHLEEFAMVRSGAAPPRGPNGRLALGAGSAIVFVLIPPGTARIGAEKTQDPRADADEQPVHEVELEPFLLAKHELTQAQWERLAQGAAPSKFRSGSFHFGRDVTGQNPVEQVSWTEADRVLRRHGLTLPTEVQWEYACRAGTDTPWNSGAAPASLQGHCNLGDDWAGRFNPGWRKVNGLNDGYGVHAPVGTYAANAFGLHDMHGNVCEWCRDWHAGYGVAARNGDGLRTNAELTDAKIVRGGAFDYSAAAARSSRRDWYPPETRRASIGVRAARRLDN